MEYISKKAAVRHINSETCSALAYPSIDANINLAIVTITGRYPESGQVVNDKSTELAYVSSGRGKITITGSNYKRFEVLNEGDVILIDPTELYYWEIPEGGPSLVLIISSTPAWSPKQHRHVAE